MRITLPTRIPADKALIFASTIFCVQQYERTGLSFSVCFFAFIMLGVFAFNAGGGFSRVSGAYVFLFTLLTCGIGVSWKAVVGEAADSNLGVPQLDIAIYAVSNFMLLLVVLVNKRLTGRAKGIAAGELNYTLAALGCLVLGLLQYLLNVLGLGGPGTALAILNQLSEFFPLAIILGTIGAVRDSGGRRSVNVVSGLSMLLVLFISMTGFSKQGMFTPIACWAVAAAFTRLNLRVVHCVVLGALVAVSYIVVPLIAEGRDRVTPNAGFAERGAVVYDILTHLGQAKQAEAETQAAVVTFQGKSGYFNRPQGLIERLSILSVDDTLFNYSDRGHYLGYSPVVGDYLNFIPHFILPNKPVPLNGNDYAHEVGGFIPDDDHSTGISFSPMAEAFHLGGWTGIFLLLPAVWLSLFASLDAICGDLRRSPWGLLMVVYMAHAAAESLLSGLIWMSVFGNLGLILAIVFCTEFAPVVGALFYGGERLDAFPGPPSGAPTLRRRRGPAIPPALRPTPRNL